MADVSAMLESAVQQHQAGCLEQADMMYRQVLQEQPENPVALHSLGALAYQRGQHDVAADLVGRAIMSNPQVPQFHNTFGVILEAQGRLGEAVDAYGQAVSLKADYAEAYNNMAIALQSQGQYAEAIQNCETATLIDPDYAEAYNTMGFALQMQGRLDDAIGSYRKAAQVKPDYAEAYSHLGVVLCKQERHDEAVENYRQALRINPDYAEVYNNLGIVFKDRGRLAEAIAYYEQAIQLAPHFFEAHYNLGNALKELGRCDEAIENYQRAIQIKPGYAQAHWNRSHAYLLKGDFVNGWQGYEWRRNPELEILTYPHRHHQPRWDGSDFAGKRLLVYCEQGLGDSLQFMRYLPMVKARGGTVIFEAWKPLHGILLDSANVDHLLELSFEQKTDADFDLHISLMDLPALFGTTLETIPADVPYVLPNPQKVGHWRTRLDNPGLKVGIVWAGSPEHGNDHNRSCPLEMFAPLAAINRVKLHGLQKGEAAGQVERLSQVVAIENLSEDLHDFADTAAAVENLDLVISVDTAPAHLAGAMGKPTWTLLPFAPDWRWMLDREDSPWYPTMRLFRQKEWGDWNCVFERVTEELRLLAATSINGRYAEYAC
ncbi:MAG: tetratricopeptide repeat protein [Phycisphaerae bacterium]|nr:tetratricopeptide repeat protein [Phycisphaerae bacterium]